MTRVENLQKKLEVDAYLVDDSINLLYLTGLQLSAGILLVTKKEATLYVDGRYLEVCQEEAPMKALPLENLDLSTFKSVGFNREMTSYEAYEKLAEKTKPVPLPDLVKELRMIKDEKESTKLRTAALLGQQGLEYVKSILEEGVTEIEVANKLEIFWKEKGAKGIAFDPIIAFGANTSRPHYHPDEVYLSVGDPVLIDIGVTLDHYHSDMTRTYFFGKAHPEVEKIYLIVKEAQERALSLCKPGTLISDLDDAARNYIEDEGYGPQFSHGLGHGIGLEVHEPPSLKNKAPFDKTPLEVGMAITIEPGIYLPGVGGVRIEDTVIITKNDHENLTPEPKNLSIINK